MCSWLLLLVFRLSAWRLSNCRIFYIFMGNCRYLMDFCPNFKQLLSMFHMKSVLGFVVIAAWCQGMNLRVGRVMIHCHTVPHCHIDTHRTWTWTQLRSCSSQAPASNAGCYIAANLPPPTASFGCYMFDISWFSDLGSGCQSRNQLLFLTWFLST